MTDKHEVFCAGYGCAGYRVEAAREMSSASFGAFVGITAGRTLSPTRPGDRAMSDDIVARFHAAMSSPGVKAAATALRSALEDCSSTESFHVETLHVERLGAVFDGCIQRGGRAAQAELEAVTHARFRTEHVTVTPSRRFPFHPAFRLHGGCDDG